MLDIQFYCPRWGAEHLPWNDFLSNIQTAGFDGVEVYPLPYPKEKPEMLDLLAAKGLEFSLLHAEMVEGKDVKRYLYALERNLYQLANYQLGELRPQFITSQTGREYYGMEEMAKCFELCDRISKEIGIPIIQETHRNKWSYAAHIVAAYLKKFPSLQLALDISHWFCVSEGYLEDQQEALKLAVEHTVHLHARVGHMEGPQVTDPRAEENREALDHHLKCWDSWIDLLRSKGISKCTVTPEFGPYPYMSYHTNSNRPIASQWELNCWMKDFLRTRYQLT
ncbi:MAG: TIM barrel protein [Pedobacter sp.]|nr:TIM barrel protein [Pedobacter sp.]MDQ8054345.1 TIM barrel protein [Pedobacter sp.]